MRIAVYSRVSTLQQSDEAQFEELVALCKRSKWTVVRTYREKVSGTKAAADRPELKKLLLEAKQRKRQGRRLERRSIGSIDASPVSVLGELNDCGVQIFSYKQGIDSSTPVGSMLWQFLGIFAEFEHGIRRERQAIGVAKARERGVKFGRPKLPAYTRSEILKLVTPRLGNWMPSSAVPLLCC